MGVPKEYAVPLVNLFGDPTAVVNAWNKIQEEQQKQQETQNNVNEVKEINNDIDNTLQKSEQEK
jgi:hypothetical protein